MARPTSDMTRWAKLGAQARLAELHAELASIYRAFPDLKHGLSASRGVPLAAGGRRKRREFSAAGKKAISQGMREYWARRKAQAAKAAKVSK